MKRRRPTGRRWTVQGIAFGAVARAAVLARSALAHSPDFVLASYLLGQVALAQAVWPEAAAAFRHVLEQYPGSLAAHEALRRAVERMERPAAAGGRSR
jgi:cytochrome c-type biogenesis protein CcmH/NrfG